MSKFFLDIHKFIDIAKDLDEIKAYNELMKKEPKVSDFICFDNDGFALNDHVPMFKGWEVHEESSCETKKAVILRKKDGFTRITFHNKEGVCIDSLTNMSTEVTYNDLAYFFENKLEMNENYTLIV